MGGSFEDLVRRDVDLGPTPCNGGVDRGAVDALFEPGPADRGRAHRTRLPVGVQAQVPVGVQRVFAGELIPPGRVRQDGGTVVDGGDFTYVLTHQLRRFIQWLSHLPPPSLNRTMQRRVPYGSYGVETHAD